MPSFDVVSKVDMHELKNAVDQANREISNRFDFRGVDARVELDGNIVSVVAPTDFQVKQIEEILCAKLAKRQVDIRSIDYADIEINLNQALQKGKVCQGFDTEKAKKLVKLIKSCGVRVQAAICGDQVRVNGKKRDDLQQVISFLRESNFELPLQFDNFRD